MDNLDGKRREAKNCATSSSGEEFLIALIAWNNCCSPGIIDWLIYFYLSVFNGCSILKTCYVVSNTELGNMRRKMTKLKKHFHKYTKVGGGADALFLYMYFIQEDRK